jgi:hypothetical protein
MRPTRWYVLVAIALVVGAVAYTVTRTSYDNLPGPTVSALFWLLLLTIADLYLAAMTRARLAGKPGTKPINPLVVARFAALAKASSVVGSVFAGGYAGFLIWVGRLDSPASNHDTKIGAVGVGLALLLVGAALLLEHACRVPQRDDDEDSELSEER